MIKKRFLKLLLILLVSISCNTFFMDEESMDFSSLSGHFEGYASTIDGAGFFSMDLSVDDEGNLYADLNIDAGHDAFKGILEGKVDSEGGFTGSLSFTMENSSIHGSGSIKGRFYSNFGSGNFTASISNKEIAYPGTWMCERK